MSSFFNNIKAFLQALSPKQQVTLGAAFVGSLGLLGFIIYLNGQPSYTLLFGNLNPDDATTIVESLREENIAFELRNEGTAIYVDRENVYELRMRFASEGLVSDGIQGYELFDQGTLGMTDFMQKVTIKRATEGELARTISNLDQVETARVHLVIPERSPFVETQTEPSASVTLQLRRGAVLSSGQIEAVSALVAGAVEDLNVSNVTILDMQSNLLSNPDQGNPDAAASSTQLRMQRAVEEHLTGKGQSMLDVVLGKGNAIVRVAAELDFSRGVTERQMIDPESATVISEERNQEELQGGNDNSQASIRNYELNRTSERLEKSVGDIGYLTVSVILNQKPIPSDTEEGEVSYQTYLDAELAEIESIVKNAVGFNPERGDRFAITQKRFDTSIEDDMAQELAQQHQQEQIQLYLRYGLMAAALLLAIWLMRSAAQRFETLVDPEIPSATATLVDGKDSSSPAGLLSEVGGDGYALPKDAKDLILVDDYYTSKLSDEAKLRLKAKHKMFERIQKQVLDNPQEAVEVIKTWMSDEIASLSQEV